MTNVVCQQVCLTINDNSSLLLKGIIVYSPVHFTLTDIISYVESNHGLVEGLTKTMYADTKQPIIDNKYSFLLVDEQSKKQEACEQQ